MLLDDLPKRRTARIAAIDWTQLPGPEGQRLRAMGIDEGAEIETLYRGILFGRDPIALKIGRMVIAIRRRHARAITVENAQSVEALAS